MQIICGEYFCDCKKLVMGEYCGCVVLAIATHPINKLNYIP